MGRMTVVPVCLATLAVCAASALGGNGDVDGDGRVSIVDAVHAARMSVYTGLGTSAEQARADVWPLTSDTGDGLITFSDARYILRIVAGFEEHPAWITVPVFAYRVCDDNGTRCTAITPEQVQFWVDYANTAYAPARVRLTFDPADFVTINSTLLNNMTGTSDPEWILERDAGNRLAGDRWGYITVIFRHGPGPSPTGGGFSWWDYDFAVMPGFYDTSVCGHQNRGLFGHELGHYFGMAHTFAATFDTVAQAESYLASHNGDVNSFNGDDFSDTPPDPFIGAIQCDSSESVVLSGHTVPIARHNIMSYWESPTRTLTAQQSQRLRWMIRTRGRNGMQMPTNAGLTSAIEADSLPVAISTGVSYGWQGMAPWGASRWNGGDQLFCGAQKGGSITLNITIAQARTYFVSVYLTQAPDFGIVRVFIDGEQVGDTFDAYAFQVMPSGRVPLGYHALSVGTHSIRFDSVSKNPMSSNYYFGIDCLTLLSRA